MSNWPLSPNSPILEGVDTSNDLSNSTFPLEERFKDLTQQWKEETQFLTSTTDIAMNPCYQSIIGMGPVALPWILNDLEHNSGYWYWALKAISNEDPVPTQDRGKIQKMKAAWLNWGKIKGHI